MLGAVNGIIAEVKVQDLLNILLARSFRHGSCNQPRNAVSDVGPVFFHRVPRKAVLPQRLVGTRAEILQRIQKRPVEIKDGGAEAVFHVSFLLIAAGPKREISHSGTAFLLILLSERLFNRLHNPAIAALRIVLTPNSTRKLTPMKNTKK